MVDNYPFDVPKTRGLFIINQTHWGERSFLEHIWGPETNKGGILTFVVRHNKGTILCSTRKIPALVVHTE